MWRAFVCLIKSSLKCEDLAAEHKRNKRRVLELWSRLISDGIAAGARACAIDSRMAAFSIRWDDQLDCVVVLGERRDGLADRAGDRRHWHIRFGEARDRPTPNTLGAAIKNLKADIANPGSWRANATSPWILACGTRHDGHAWPNRVGSLPAGSPGRAPRTELDISDVNDENST
jgi:hypothetical protein